MGDYGEATTLSTWIVWGFPASIPLVSLCVCVCVRLFDNSINTNCGSCRVSIETRTNTCAGRLLALIVFVFACLCPALSTDYTMLHSTLRLLNSSGSHSRSTQSSLKFIQLTYTIENVCRPWWDWNSSMTRRCAHNENRATRRSMVARLEAGQGNFPRNTTLVQVGKVFWRCNGRLCLQNTHTHTDAISGRKLTFTRGGKDYSQWVWLMQPTHTHTHANEITSVYIVTHTVRQGHRGKQTNTNTFLSPAFPATGHWSWFFCLDFFSPDHRHQVDYNDRQ